MISKFIVIIVSASNLAEANQYAENFGYDVAENLTFNDSNALNASGLDSDPVTNYAVTMPVKHNTLYLIKEIANNDPDNYIVVEKEDGSEFNPEEYAQVLSDNGLQFKGTVTLDEEV